jgi:16S rRNA G966 N2-methylase RsmD
MISGLHRTAHGEGARFDFVFLDAPYADGTAALRRKRFSKRRHVRRRRVVVEQQRTSARRPD